jgi:hypothetical protein
MNHLRMHQSETPSDPYGLSPSVGYSQLEATVIDHNRLANTRRELESHLWVDDARFRLHLARGVVE